MKKILFILCTPILLFAQNNTHQIKWNSNLTFESSTLNKSFLNTMLYGGYITDSMKTNWINAGGSSNVLYSELSNELSYIYTFNKQNIGFSFADRNILNASFTDDLLRLVFEGNFHHQGKTLDFGGTSIRADRFQQYKLNYGYKNINIGLSYLAGNHHLSYIIDKGTFYTSTLGNEIDIAYNINAFVTDTSNLAVFANNGNGLAIDFNTNFKIDKYKVDLSLTDLGFIMWNNSSITLATDSNFNFKGIEIEDPLNFNDSILELETPSTDDFKTNNSSFKSYIPATLHIAVSGESKHEYFKTYKIGFIAKWQPYQDNTQLSFAKIEQGFKESNYSPLFYLSSSVITKYGAVLPNISYGGYTKDFNIGLAYSIGKKVNFTLGTQHLEDLVRKNKATALSVYLTLSTQF